MTINTKLSAVFLFLSLASAKNGQAQGSGPLPDKQALETKLLTAVKAQVDNNFAILTDDVSTDGNDNILSGTATCFGNSLNFRSSFNVSNVLMTFQVTPQTGAAVIPWTSVPFVGRMYPDTSLLKLPAAIRNNLGLSNATVNFASDGLAVATTKFELGYNTSWTILKEAKLRLTNIVVSIDVDASALTNATGTLQGNFSMAGASNLSLTAQLSKNPADWKLSAAISDFSFGELLDNFSFTQSTFNNASVFSHIMGSTNASLDIYPFKQQLSLTVANSNFGTLNVQVERLESANVATSGTAATRTGWGLLAGYSFPTDFAFNSDKMEAPWRQLLTFLDNVKSQTGVYFSTYEGEPASMLPVFEELGFEGPIYKGVTFITGMNISNGYQNLRKMLANTSFKKLLVKDIPVDHLVLQANLPLDPAEMRVEAEVGFKDNFNFGEIVWLHDIKLIFEANSGSPVFSLATNISAKLDPANPPLDFFFKGSAEPTGLTISGSGAMTNYWNNPYGFPIKIGKMVVGTGINFSYELPVLDNTIVSGEMEFGGISCDGTLGFDVNDFKKNFIQAKIAGLDFRKITTFFSGPNISNKIKNVPYLGTVLTNSKLDTAEIRLAPRKFNLMSYGVDKEIQQGFAVKGGGNVSSWNGSFEFTLDGPDAGINAGLSALGSMSSIEKKSGSLTLFKLSAAQGKTNPELFVDLTASHVINGVKSAFLGSSTTATPDRFVYINGAINILEAATAGIYMELTDKGYSCKLDGNLYGFLKGSVNAQITSFTDPQNSYVSATISPLEFQNKVLSYLPKQLSGLGFGDDIFQELNKKVISVQTVGFDGTIDGLKSSAAVKVAYRLGSESHSITATVPVGAEADFFRGIALQMANDLKSACNSIKDQIVNAGTTVYNGLVTTANTSTSIAKTAGRETQKVVAEITSVKSVSSTAGDVFNQSTKVVSNFGAKTMEFSSNVTSKVKLIADNQINQGKNTWKKFKQWITGSDNEELVTMNGPAFKMYTKFPGYIVKGNASYQKMLAATIGTVQNTPEEAWQLVPCDKEGMIYLVSGYNGLSVTKARNDYCRLIPHESDHKNRERLILEQVPNEPGWYYLKYPDDNIYIRLKKVVTEQKQTVVALVPVAGRQAIDSAKFRFQKSGDIDWDQKSTLPPAFFPAKQLTQGAFYIFADETSEGYQFLNGQFRWLPDMETKHALQYFASNKSPDMLTADYKMGATVGAPLPSRKNGNLYQAQGDPNFYLMFNFMRYKIPDAATATQMGLNLSWVQRISVQDLQSIPAGIDIPPGATPGVRLIEKAIYRVTGDTKVYVVLGNTFRQFPDNETIMFMGYKLDSVQEMSSNDFKTLTVGQPLASWKTGALVQATGGGDIFVMENGRKRKIPDIETFASKGYSQAAIQKISATDLGVIPRGLDLISVK